MEPERLFKRKIYNRLLKWKKESNGKSALLIEGARRIGKSTIVKSFRFEMQLYGYQKLISPYFFPFFRFDFFDFFIILSALSMTPNSSSR